MKNLSLKTIKVSVLIIGLCATIIAPHKIYAQDSNTIVVAAWGVLAMGDKDDNLVEIPNDQEVGILMFINDNKLCLSILDFERGQLLDTALTANLENLYLDTDDKANRKNYISIKSVIKILHIEGIDEGEISGLQKGELSIYMSKADDGVDKFQIDTPTLQLYLLGGLLHEDMFERLCSLAVPGMIANGNEKLMEMPIKEYIKKYGNK